MNFTLKIISTDTYQVVENINENVNSDKLFINDDNDDENKVIDISIFTTNEWKNIQKLGEIFANNSAGLNNDSDESYSRVKYEYKENAYWLYHKGFKYGFRDSEFDECYSISGYKIPKILTKFSQKHSTYTFNKFREWICKHYTEMIEKTSQ